MVEVLLVLFIGNDNKEANRSANLKLRGHSWSNAYGPAQSRKKKKKKKEREGDKERKKNGKEKNMYGALESGGSWRSLKKKGGPSGSSVSSAKRSPRVATLGQCCRRDSTE
jgi:hypothetical protein